MASAAESEDSPIMELLHVHNLPQPYTKPRAEALLEALELLTLRPSGFSQIDGNHGKRRVDPAGVPRYLTGIISSTLSWIDDEFVKDRIWTAAAARLSERSGRSAMPDMTRTFTVSNEIEIALKEPSLTGDSLGLKTWSSSLLLSRRLRTLASLCSVDESTRVLELGAGTGLVGIAAACVWGVNVTLTDLPEIMANLEINLRENEKVVRRFGGSTTSQTLDWSDPGASPSSASDRFDIILAADPIYSPDHPKMLVDVVSRWIIATKPRSRFILELPLRDGYDSERQELRRRLEDAGFTAVSEGIETGYDDWQGRDGEYEQVTCWWSVWRKTVVSS